MSLIKSKTLIAPVRARTPLDSDASTRRKGNAGTKNLTQVRRGGGKRQAVDFICEQVLPPKAEQNAAAPPQNAKIRRFVS